MTENVIKANRLPAITWNWLKMNDVSVDVGGLKGEGSIELQVPQGLDISQVTPEEKAVLDKAETGMGKAVADFFGESLDAGFSVAVDKDVKSKEPVRLNIKYADDKSAVRGYIAARENSELFIINDMTGNKALSGGQALETRLLLKEGAKVKLVEVYDAGEDAEIVSNIGAELSDGAELSLIQIFLGGKKVSAGALAALSGEKSAFYSDTAYQVPAGSSYDFNYVARHYGKDTYADMNANGVLNENSYKQMRQTIDFLKGCAGATGKERENVMLMNEKLINKTIPLILCQEEDVVGEHGASIGKLSEEILYYLKARGLSEDQIYELVAGGKLMSVVSKINDEETEKKLSARILGSAAGEEE